jgi:Ca2+-binding EF-hand superfamily protein
MRHGVPILMSACVALALAGCASGRHRHKPRPQWHPAVNMLLADDANHDGTITRAEMEKGLHRDFARDDTDHDGRLNEDEVRTVNQRRWAKDASTTSPLVDWNHDGYVDFDEFAAAPRSLFAEIDRDGNGVLSPAELKAARAGSRPEAPHHARPRGRRRGEGGRRPGGDGDGDGD